MMTLRYKLANWISGGELDRKQDTVDTMYKHATNSYDKLFIEIQETMRLRSAMRKITSMETPSANATVKRMASVAREALK